MILKISIVIIALLLTGCSTLEFKPKSRYVIIAQFYDSLYEVQKICGAGKNGCHKLKNSVHYIDSIKSRCVFDHELDHVFYGSFHKYGAGCIVRAE